MKVSTIERVGILRAWLAGQMPEHKPTRGELKAIGAGFI